MRLFHIANHQAIGKDTERFLSEACAVLEVEYVLLSDRKTTIQDLLAIEASESDGFYRSTRTREAKDIERFLAQKGMRSIYNDPKVIISGKGSTHYHLEWAGLPVVPSLPIIPRKKSDTEYVAELLGGFPIVIKVAGGMEGIGVMRVDSAGSYNSVMDYLRKDDQNEIRVMRYIPHRYFARVVVVGDQVVASTRDVAPPGDFRANALGRREEQIETFQPSEEVSQVAIKAVSALNTKIGGVDVMYADSGEFYLSEVNAPFNFAETQRVTDIKIAEAIVKVILF